MLEIDLYMKLHFIMIVTLSCFFSQVFILHYFECISTCFSHIMKLYFIEAMCFECFEVSCIPTTMNVVVHNFVEKI